MFTPPSFREEDPSVLRDFMRRHSFEALFNWTDQGPIATHLPFLVEDWGRNGGRPYGSRESHRRSFAAGREVLVAFTGPHAYISPS